MIFYYVRHGDPIYVPDSLTEYGREQAKALAKRFKLYGLDEIYSSPSIRALQTAQPTCDILNKEPNLLDWTNESLAWQDFTIEREGKRGWFFHNNEYIDKWHTKSILATDKYCQNELEENSLRRGMERINQKSDEFFLKLGFEHDRVKGFYRIVKSNQKRIALFAHEAFGYAFLSSVLDIPYPLVCTRFGIGHSGVTVIYFDEKNDVVFPKVLQHSNDSHLYKEGILKGYHSKIDI